MTDADELSVIQWNDSNKLLALYRAGIDNPDQKSRDKKYTNAELALRIDLGKKRLVFTGNFWQDLKYMLWNNHAVLSLLRANYLDPFTRKGRFIVLLVTMSIAGMSSVLMSADLGFTDDNDDKKKCIEMDNCKWPWLILTSLLVLVFTMICRKLWSCNCAQGGNNKVRCLAEKTGSLIVMSIGAVMLLCVVTVGIALKIEPKKFFMGFIAIKGLAWAKGVLISSFLFWYRAYPKEKRAVEQAAENGKKLFNLTVPDLEARGIEINANYGCCPFLRRITIVPTLIFFLMGDQNDYTVEASSGSATEMGAAGRNVVKKV